MQKTLLPVQRVLQELHVLGGVLFQMAFWREGEREGGEGVREKEGARESELIIILLLAWFPSNPSQHLSHADTKAVQL